MKKEYFTEKIDENKSNRESNINFGLPNKTMAYNNGKVIYDIDNEKWKCTICNFARDKFNRKQVMNHVNSKHINNTKKLHIINTRLKGKLKDQDNETLVKWEMTTGE